jgi:hypothetical protein
MSLRERYKLHRTSTYKDFEQLRQQITDEEFEAHKRIVTRRIKEGMCRGERRGGRRGERNKLLMRSLKHIRGSSQGGSRRVSRERGGRREERGDRRKERGEGGEERGEGRRERGEERGDRGKEDQGG